MVHQISVPPTFGAPAEELHSALQIELQKALVRARAAGEAAIQQGDGSSKGWLLSPP